MTALLDDVVARFEVTGAATPGWPPPRPFAEPPREEEYSRVLDPAKYQIMAARLAAWRDVLTARGAVREVVPEAVAPPHAAYPPDRYVRWLPTAPGALPLTIGFRGLDGVSDTLVELGLGSPVVWMQCLPECGCDACDDGSARLLEHLDGVVDMIVSGRFLRVDTPTGHVQTTRDGWEASNLSDAGSVLAAARAGNSPHRVTTGAAWL